MIVDVFGKWIGVSLVIHVFIDESGELGTKAGSSRFFLIAMLSVPSPRALEKRIWKEKAKLYNAGWPKDLEIKGTSVWGCQHNPRIPPSISGRRVEILRDIITSICYSDVKIFYSIAQKCHLSARLMAVDYGIAYNYLAGTLISRCHANHLNGPLEIVVDQRSKETHSKLKFDGYLETRLIGDCAHDHPLSIQHAESHNIPGLQSVDFISWGLFRHYEFHDSQFKNLIDPKVVYRDDWYSERKKPA